MTQTNDRVDPNRPKLPETLTRKLVGFRKHVRRIKMTEVIFAVLFGFLASYLLAFGLDRMMDTPAVLRWTLLLAAVGIAATSLPRQVWRWIWRTRSFEQLSRLISRKSAAIGDQLLGTVELSRDDLEWGRSPVLVAAAIEQTGTELEHRDLIPLQPPSRHRAWGKALLAPSLIVFGLAIGLPTVSVNALERWIAPWSDTPRYTFARVSNVAKEIVVPRGEPSELVVPLLEESRWRPKRALAQVDGIECEATLVQGAYRFQLPPLIAEAELTLRVGDAFVSTGIRPIDRTEIRRITATTRLPKYLDIPEPVLQDGRSGSITVVEQSHVQVNFEASRALSLASDGGDPIPVKGARFGFSLDAVATESAHELTWEDEHGLTGSASVKLFIRTKPDEAPRLTLSGLQQELVLLESETLNFSVQGEDDYGVREIGVIWEGVEDPLDNPTPTKGERIVAAGKPNESILKASVAFNPKRLEIPAQVLRLQVYANDAFPGRPRVVSSQHTVLVLTPEQHMVWLTGQLAEWLESAIEIRDGERELYQKNVALRKIPATDLDDPKMRRQLERQARAERANGRRLDRLTEQGTALLAQAARNSEFNVATMNDWAEMLKALQDIGANRMPSISDLLAKASAAADSDPTKPTPEAGVHRAEPLAGEPDAPTKQGQTAPAVADVESSFNEADASSKSNPDQPPTQTHLRLSLAGTVVQGGGPKAKPEDTPPASPAQQQLDEAIEEQTALLAEFDRVAGKITEVLRNLEGSTFVKRFKAASRRQTQIAGKLNDSLEGSFGVGPEELDVSVRNQLVGAAELEQTSAKRLSIIQSDLEAYSSRGSNPSARTVLDEMKTSSASSSLAEISRSVDANFSGDSIAQAEFWSDTLDRWAEQLVGPG